ncbi:uncharacterized protein LOC125178986 [Hyalella azteca]|uniref:Uncharacterized protein LOC125178986 n=1 Tax=Hyalella azteca TaxID=294128 RepID=A0A979FTK5_HYAAZ|nr:uncharacterized protein LOC125178986 [Hyalella azteca]
MIRTTESLPFKRRPFSTSLPANLTHINGLHEFLDSPTGQCDKLVEIGGTWFCDGFDGNKDVCLDPWYTPAYNSCLIYSFGVGNDITFEKIMSDLWGCQVFLHDHTVNHTNDFFGSRHVHRPWGIANVSHVDDDGRTLVTYKDALAANGHVGAQVHYLKIDIEEQEYHVLPNIFASGLLENVWQLHMEIHNFWREWESSELYIQRNKTTTRFYIS